MTDITFFPFADDREHPERPWMPKKIERVYLGGGVWGVCGKPVSVEDSKYHLVPLGYEVSE